MTTSNNKKILVIDDDAMNREVMEAFLLSEGYEVLLASDGQKGLDFAHQYQPNAIILDVRMPDMSGYSVCEKLKQSAETNMAFLGPTRSSHFPNKAAEAPSVNSAIENIQPSVVKAQSPSADSVMPRI